MASLALRLYLFERAASDHAPEWSLGPCGPESAFCSQASSVLREKLGVNLDRHVEKGVLNADEEARADGARGGARGGGGAGRAGHGVGSVAMAGGKGR